jgi:hypothetical protein
LGLKPVLVAVLQAWALQALVLFGEEKASGALEAL